MMMQILRRTVALSMVLAMLAVPGVLSGSAMERTKDGDIKGKPVAGRDMGFAAFDTVNKYQNEEGLTVTDYLKGDVLIKREIDKGDIIEVYMVGADGVTLEMTGTIDKNQTEPLPTSPSRVDKFTDDQGRTIIEVYENGFLFTREVYDPTTGEHVISTYDKDGKVYDTKSYFDDGVVVPDPPSDDIKTYPDEAGNKVADFIKDGVVVRREIYFPDRMEVYLPDASGELVLDKSLTQVYPTEPPSFYDDIQKYPDKNDDTVVDYLMKGTIVRREIYYKDGRFEVFLPDAAGNLLLDPTQSGESGSGGGATDPETPPDKTLVR